MRPSLIVIGGFFLAAFLTGMFVSIEVQSRRDFAFRMAALERGCIEVPDYRRILCPRIGEEPK